MKTKQLMIISLAMLMATTEGSPSLRSRVASITHSRQLARRCPSDQPQPHAISLPGERPRRWEASDQASTLRLMA